MARISRALDVMLTSLPDGDLPARTEEVGYAMVVGDGMGGLAAGEHASMLAIRTGVRLVLDSPRWSLAIDDKEARELIERMRGYFRKVDQVLIHSGAGDSSLAGMGTTLTVAYSVGTDVFIVHAGDSRAYLFRRGQLYQLTRDHTVAQLLAEAGAIRPEEVSTHARRHMLTNFAGGPYEGIDPDIYTLNLADEDRILLCSDGLHEMVDDPTIAQTLRDHPESQSACRALVERALERGGRDNVTVILGRYAVPGPEPSATP